MGIIVYLKQVNNKNIIKQQRRKMYISYDLFVLKTSNLRQRKHRDYDQQYNMVVMINVNITRRLMDYELQICHQEDIVIINGGKTGDNKKS